MAQSILILTGAEEVSDTQPELLRGGRGPDFAEIPLDTLKENLRRFMDSIREILPSTTHEIPGDTPGAPNAAQEQGSYRLRSFNVAVAINGKGQVGFLGTGVEVGASATLTLTFALSA